MTKDLYRNKFDYSILAILAAIFLFFFFSSHDQPLKMFLSLVVFSLSYFFWGVFHHLKLKNLNFKIMLEYALISMLAIVLAGTLFI